MSPTEVKPWQRVVLWRGWRSILPTATTLYFNHHHLSGGLKTVELPPDGWAQDEAKALLLRSEERLRSLEAKGPGLATVAAVVGAGVVAAIIEGGSNTTLLGKILLVIAAWYSVWSLLIPIYLVGPQPRDTIDLNHLIVAADEDSPEQYLATRSQEAAQGNVRRAQRIANLQDAARNELAAALAVLTAWLVLGPAIGLLQLHESSSKREARPPSQTGTPAPTSLSTKTSTLITTTPRTATAPGQSSPARTPTTSTPSTGGAQAPSGSP